MAVPMDVILLSTVDDYLSTNAYGKMNGTVPNRVKIKEDVVNQTRTMIEMQNALLSKGTKLRIPDRLAAIQIARIIQRVELVACICCEKQDSEESPFDLIGVYNIDGPNKGVYDTSERALDMLISEYNFAATAKDVEDVKVFLRRLLDRKQRCMNPDLIAVNNGIFNYKTKILEPFDPDKVFLTKSRVDYNPNAQNIIIHNPDDNTDWDVESWMAELSDDSAIVELLWQVLGAIIRPFVRWDQSAWFYSASGNSGKGTLCELMRNLCGRGCSASISLSDFSKDFHLEPLIHSSAIIVDENDVGVYLDKVANLKAVITNDVVLINRKFKTPVSYQFFGFMVQCLNEYPKIRDTSESFYRRQLFIPFDKCFTGKARKYIKDDYLSRKEVLEYVLFKVLNTNYYKLSEPAACRLVLEDYKEYNNPIQSFAEEVIPETVWGILPFGFLYDLYKAWFTQNSPSGKVHGRNTFVKEICDMVDAGKIPEFTTLGRKTPIRPKKLMDTPEPLIMEYKLDRWMNPDYRGSDPQQICVPKLKATYTGLVRVGNESDAAMPDACVQADDLVKKALAETENNKNDGAC